MCNLYIIIPADVPTGPVKGAYALANALIGRHTVTLVALKPGAGAKSWLDPRVKIICLADLSDSLYHQIYTYQSLLRESGGRKMVVSLSMCFSADIFNIFCRRNAMIWSSVRGNLFVNYYHDYGFFGLPLAMLHLFSLRWHDRVVAMNTSMATQIQRITGHYPDIIENFLDESPLEGYRQQTAPSGSFHFVFVGSLSQRKQPLLIIKAIKELKDRGIDSRADFIGDGILRGLLRSAAVNAGIADAVTFHGFKDKPGTIVGKADAMVLPSLSEGISRAAMEALYLGVPCVLRDVDSNAELVQEGVNGALFINNQGLADAMLRAALLSRTLGRFDSLLPNEFRQGYAADRYLQLLGSVNG